ncbi:MAG: DUF1439 domain-containing protein [Burkholderiaceae bacterium]|nr:DUF1439 domain-containing protein [Burkholderiaceae bacterium]
MTAVTRTPPDTQALRRRALLGLPAALGLLAVAGCAGLGGPSVITLGEAELARLLSRAFPQQRRLLETVDMTLSLPQLTLLPERNRLVVDLTAQAVERFGGRSGQGRMVFDSALRYEPRDATVRLTQVRVQQLQFELGRREAAAPAATAAAAAPSGFTQRLAQTLAEQLLQELVIYRLTPERLAQLKSWGVEPGAVTVTSRGVEITLARAG